jgi:hypothetical protein
MEEPNKPGATDERRTKLIEAGWQEAKIALDKQREDPGTDVTEELRAVLEHLEGALEE